MNTAQMTTKEILEQAPAGKARIFARLLPYMNTTYAGMIARRSDGEVFALCLEAGLGVDFVEKISKHTSLEFVLRIASLVRHGMPEDHVVELHDINAHKAASKGTIKNRLEVYFFFLDRFSLPTDLCLHIALKVGDDVDLRSSIARLLQFGISPEELRILVDNKLVGAALNALYNRSITKYDLSKNLELPHLSKYLSMRDAGVESSAAREVLDASSARGDIGRYHDMINDGISHSTAVQFLGTSRDDFMQRARLFDLGLTDSQIQEVLATSAELQVLYARVKKGCEVSHEEAQGLVELISNHGCSKGQPDWVAEFIRLWQANKVSPLQMREVAKEGMDCEELRLFVESDISYSEARRILKRGISAEDFLFVFALGAPIKLIYQASKHDLSLEDMAFALENGLTAEEFLDIAV